LVKALVEGFGGKPGADSAKEFYIPPEAMRAMQDSAMAEIATRAGNRLPIIKGRDKGLPKAPPTFDVDELKRRNEAVRQKRRAN
jgi:hypothetical protein